MASSKVEEITIQRRISESVILISEYLFSQHYLIEEQIEILEDDERPISLLKKLEAQAEEIWNKMNEKEQILVNKLMGEICKC